MRSQGGVTSGFQRLNARFDRGLIDTDNLVMLVHVDVKSFAKGDDQMLLI